MKRLVAIALTLILCLSLCFFAAAEETDVYGKYEEPIKLTILSEDFKTGNTNYDANDPRRASATQNVWIDAYKDYLNIDVERQIAEDETALAALINTAMASGDLPDVIICNKAMFYTLVENGVLQDVRAAYEGYQQKRLVPEPQEGQCGTLLYLADGREMPPGLLNLIPRYFQEELEGWALLRSESGALFHRLVWKRVRPLSWYSSVLERLQGALAESCGLKLSILLSPLPDDARTLPEALRRMEEACATLKADGSEEPFVYTLSQPVEQDVNPCRQLQTYIRSHLKGDLSLTQLGNITGYNGDYLNRMFRRETGEPIGRYIAACKLERLRSLLQNPDMTIERAAWEVGFTSRSYFNRFVRRETGMSPNSFRETLLGEARSENRSEAQTTGEVHAFDTKK